MTSVAILCVARNETPFAEEWLEYHFRIGVDRVYWISTDDDHSAIEALLANGRFSSRVERFRFDIVEPGWQARAYDQHFRQIAEDWIVVIDLDEFLYLHEYSSIHEYLDRFGKEVGQVQFPWLNHVSAGYVQDRVLDILASSAMFASDHVKSAVRRERAVRFGIHRHQVGRSATCLSSGDKVANRARHEMFIRSPEYFSQHPFVLHFCGRGHLDVINRIVGYRSFDAKSGPDEVGRLSRYLQEPATWENIPNRYLLWLFYLTLPATSASVDLPALTARTDTKELVRIFSENIEKVVGFDCSDAERIAVDFEHRFGLRRKLSGQDLRSVRDLGQYQAFKTQLDYLVKLREQLLSERHIVPQC